MSDPTDNTSSDSHKEVQRGAAVNALGVAGKMAGPAFLVLVNRLFGTDVFGVFIVAVALVEMANALMTAGFRDGTVMLLSRHIDQAKERPQVYSALANAFLWSIMMAMAVAAATVLFGPYIIPRFFEFGDRLQLMLGLMVLALPLLAFERIVLAATQGLKIMKYEALVNGWVRPFVLLVFALLFWRLMPNDLGIVWAYLATQAVVVVTAAFIYTREFSWANLRDAFRSLTVHRELLSFAWPQNLNRTLERFITNVDVVMLGLLGASAFSTGLYGSGAAIVKELRQTKLIFSASFAPQVPRLFRENARNELSNLLSETTRWTTQLIVPVVIALAFLRSDLLGIVHPEYGRASSLFMLWLLPIPYLQSAFGLAGNVIVMTGHSRLNLLNSVVTGLANVLLNLWWIPLFGLGGAAAASAAATGIRAMLEVGQTGRYLGIRFDLGKIYAPHLAGIVGFASGLAVAVWAGPLSTLSLRVLVVGAAMAGYALALAVLRRLSMR